MWMGAKNDHINRTDTNQYDILKLIWILCLYTIWELSYICSMFYCKISLLVTEVAPTLMKGPSCA